MKLPFGMTESEKLRCYIVVEDYKIEVWKVRIFELSFSFRFFIHRPTKKGKRFLDFLKQLEKEVLKHKELFQ